MTRGVTAPRRRGRAKDPTDDQLTSVDPGRVREELEHAEILPAACGWPYGASADASWSPSSREAQHLRAPRRLCPVGDIQLAEDVRQVELHSLLCHDESPATSAFESLFATSLRVSISRSVSASPFPSVGRVLGRRQGGGSEMNGGVGRLPDGDPRCRTGEASGAEDRVHAAVERRRACCRLPTRTRSPSAPDASHVARAGRKTSSALEATSTPASSKSGSCSSSKRSVSLKASSPEQRSRSCRAGLVRARP